MASVPTQETRGSVRHVDRSAECRSSAAGAPGGSARGVPVSHSGLRDELVSTLSSVSRGSISLRTVAFCSYRGFPAAAGALRIHSSLRPKASIENRRARRLKTEIGALAQSTCKRALRAALKRDDGPLQPRRGLLGRRRGGHSQGASYPVPEKQTGESARGATAAALPFKAVRARTAAVAR